ncbi:MAG: polysaccharide deacetylase family protein [Deltaproteobacteria bacterium]|nr:polysaccharide deacetylase family protein [Deltaproteobacteria bacterium]
MHPILMYHGLDAPAPHGEARYTVRREAFRDQLRHLDALRVPIVSLPQLLGGGDGVTLSFDDGEESVFGKAAPLLAQFGGVGVAYVTSDWVGSPGYLSVAHLRQLAALAWTIGAHGRSHRYLNDLDDGALRDELAGARAALEDALGAPVVDLSLPGGRGDERVLAAARAAGYTTVATSVPGLNRHLRADQLERLAVQAGDDFVRVGRLATGHLPTVAGEVAVVGALDLAQRVLGNQRYERVRGYALRVLRR